MCDYKLRGCFIFDNQQDRTPTGAKRIPLH
jgi:hypothetical protein